jgi:hypothetical protein
VSPPRIVVPGATTALVRRTVLRKAFLAPWDPEVEQVWLFSLADAQQATDVEVHYSGLNISHHHTDVTPRFDNLPEFTRRFHRDMSCGLHDLLCKRRYDAPRELFDDRPTHWTRLLDAEAQASRLVYDAINAVAAGLVARPEDMPLRFLDFGLWKTREIVVARPDLDYFEDRPDTLTLELSPPPLLYRAFGGDLDRLVHHMRRLLDEAVRCVRARRSRPVLGAKGVRRIHPWDEPRTMRESGPNPNRTFQIGARDILGRAQDRHARREVRAFRSEHAATRIARRDGDLEALYPFGTYAARVFQGAPVDEVRPDAFVTAPGPLLEDVCASVVEERPAREDGAASAQRIGDAVREAFAEDAAEIVDDATLDLVSRGPVEPRAERAQDEDEAKPSVLVRRRFEHRTPTSARRTVTLRDTRRGRPPTGGSDPPAR